ncbi:MAG: AraC family transcriptional regulator [Salinisphaeraceae bacterium]|nr:AraC family transcriptional regulator [Salinisphaeraceae bacterium]
MSHNATTLSSWVRCIKAALDARGIDSLALFAQAGLDPSSLSDPNARYPQAGITALWRLAVQASGDEAFGLDVSRQVNQTTFHAMGYSLLASPSLEECFSRILRYFRIVSDAAELDFQQQPKDQYKFFMHPLPGDSRPSDEAIDALMSVLIRLCRALAGKAFRAQEVTLLRPPPHDPSPWEKVFKAPVSFNAKENAIVFKGSDIRAPLPFANPELARHNDAILTRYLAHFDKENTANRVHATLVEMLPEGEPSQEKVANCLHLSLRNLQRKLSDEGTSYKQILNNTRQDLALSYIADSSYTISEITYLLGFSDSSSFTRAFKRWTGQSPSAYRQAQTSKTTQAS